MLLVGGGSGVVPLVAMIRHRAQVARDVPALLVDSSRTWDDVIFREELFALQADDTHLSVVLTTTRERRRRAQDFERRLDRSILRDILDRWTHEPRHVYVCGSNAFVESVSGALLEESVPTTRIRTERYGSAS